jgi:hypothetical protein
VYFSSLSHVDGQSSAWRERSETKAILMTPRQFSQVCARVSSLLLIPAFAAWATGRPFIFPSLGPSAFALAVGEDVVTARRMIGGHAVGITSGLLAYHSRLREISGSRWPGRSFSQIVGILESDVRVTA